MARKEYTDQEQRSYLYWLLARRDYSREKLVEKLNKRGLNRNESLRLLSELEDEKIFRPENYEESRIAALYRKGFSVRGIRAKLSQEKISYSPEEIERVLDDRCDLNIDDNKIRFFEECLQRYSSELEQKNNSTVIQKALNKVLQRILRKGYSANEFWAYYREREQS